jgi:methylated-DNA-[protein]-cysteine S-methyltransferase
MAVNLDNLQQHTAYFNSPVGILEIKTTGDTLNTVHFVNSWKGPKLSADEIHYDTDLPAYSRLCISQLKEYFSGSRKTFNLKLSQAGTDFQLKVWNELLNIGYGKTISYLELSKRIGDVKAIRAVGTTNGKNSISIIVPCHRVIGSNGTLVGYGGDLWRKKWLLAHENKWANGVQQLF